MNQHDQKKRKKCKCGNPVGKDSIEKGDGTECGNCYWFFQPEEKIQTKLKGDNRGK